MNLACEKIFNLEAFVETAESTGKEIAQMSSIELSVMCDTLFRTNPKIAEWIARDLEVRAMDKAICEAESQGEIL